MIDEIAALDLIRTEYSKACRQYMPFHNQHEAYAVILEELDELFNTIKQKKPYNAKKEAAQVAAMAMRFLTDLRWLDT